LKHFYQAGWPTPDTPISQVPMVALDLETTGLDARRDVIVSIGDCAAERPQHTVAEVVAITISASDRETKRWHGVFRRLNYLSHGPAL